MVSHLQKVFLALLFLAVVSAQAEDTNFFPIMAWNSAPTNLAALRQMKECGLTVAGFTGPKNLNLVRKAGLKAIVSDARIAGLDWSHVDDKVARSNVTSLVAEVGKNPAVYGYYLRDEPGADLFNGLAKVVSLLRERAPDKWAYINLFPNYATSDQLNTKTYSEYLQKFCDVCQPTTLSYDHYALMEGNTLGGGYWKNLEQMRLVAMSNSLPFWNIVQAMGMLAFREPTTADFRFQVYSTLAYGGRGLAYFQYSTSGTGNWRMSPVDPFGHTTTTWNYMRDVNLQVAQLAPTFLKLTSDDVYHLNHVPEGCHGSTNNDLIVGMDGGDYMVGDFTHRDGSRYVMIMNKSFTLSAGVFPHYRKSPKRVQFISPYTGKAADYAGEQCYLAPGAGVLLKLE